MRVEAEEKRAAKRKRDEEAVWAPAKSQAKVEAPAEDEAAAAAAVAQRANSGDQALAGVRAELAAVRAAHAQELSVWISRAEIAEKELDLAEITRRGYNANEVREAMNKVWNFDVDRDVRISAIVVQLDAMRVAKAEEAKAARKRRREATAAAAAAAAAEKEKAAAAAAAARKQPEKAAPAGGAPAPAPAGWVPAAASSSSSSSLTPRKWTPPELIQAVLRCPLQQEGKMTEDEARRILALNPYEGKYQKFLRDIHYDKQEFNLKDDAMKATRRLNEANLVVGNRSAPTKAEVAKMQLAEDLAEEKSRRDPRT